MRGYNAWKYRVSRYSELIACHSVVCVMNSEEIGEEFYPEGKGHLEDPHHHFLISHPYPPALMKN